MAEQMEIEILFKLCDLVIEYWYEEDGIEFDVLSVDGETDTVKAFEREHYSAIKAKLIEAVGREHDAIRQGDAESRAELDAIYARLG